jgi:acetylglutamate kinase
VPCVTIMLFDSLYYESVRKLSHSSCWRSMTNEAIVQSLIVVQPVTTSADNQAFKEDAQQVAARIAVGLRQAGYLCTVLDSPSSISTPSLQPK